MIIGILENFHLERRATAKGGGWSLSGQRKPVQAQRQTEPPRLASAWL